MGLAYEYFTYNGVSSRNFEVWISGDGTFDAPERDVESISIPGRNGDLHIDNGRFGNIEITYPAFITKDFRHNFDAFKAYMLSQRGYKKLVDTYHPEYFRLAAYKDAISPEMAPLNRAGSFDITFDCDPRRFLTTGEKTQNFSGGIKLKNPTQFPSNPLIRANYTGSIKVNGKTITIDRLTGVSYIDIDCELQEAYCGAINCNGHITLEDGEFPTLEPGINDIVAQRTSGSSSGLLVTFSSECATESTSYDYIYLYYKSGNTWYRSEQKLGGKNTANNLAGATAYIPTNTFLMYWRSDSSVQDWGYKIDSVVSATSGTGTINFLPATSPYSDFSNVKWEPVYVGVDPLPESNHPYGSNEIVGYEVMLVTNPMTVNITPRWWTV